MAKSKKQQTSTRLFRGIKEQTRQENQIYVIEQLEELRMHKWLNLLFTLNAAYAASEESYSINTEINRLGDRLPNQAKNTLIYLKRLTKDIDKRFLEVLKTMDREVISKNPNAKNFFELLSSEGDLEKAWTNTEIQLEFQENLIRNFTPGAIQNIMEAMNIEILTEEPVLVRNDMQIFFVKCLHKTKYIPMNIVQLEKTAKRFEVQNILTINDDTGKTIKVNKKHLKEIYNGVKGYGDEFVDKYFTNIK